MTHNSLIQIKCNLKSQVHPNISQGKLKKAREQIKALLTKNKSLEQLTSIWLAQIDFKNTALHSLSMYWMRKVNIFNYLRQKLLHEFHLAKNHSYSYYLDSYKDETNRNTNKQMLNNQT